MGLNKSLINSIDMKIRPKCGKLDCLLLMTNTHELIVNHSENIHTIIRTAMFYYNPMIPPVSISPYVAKIMSNKLNFLLAIEKIIIKSMLSLLILEKSSG